VQSNASRIAPLRRHTIDSVLMLVLHTIDSVLMLAEVDQTC